MWIIWVLIGLFLIVLVFYFRSKKNQKPDSSSIIQRTHLESLLERELTPKSTLKEIEEKGDFRYRDDYHKKTGKSGSSDLLKQESDQELKNGIKKYKAKDYDGAELEFSKIIDSGSESAAAYYYRGMIKNEKGEYMNAVSDFDLAFANGFTENDIHLQRGISNLYLKLYDKAVSEFGTFLDMNPGHIEAHFNRALAEAALENYQAAISEFSKIIELNPNHEKAYLERGKVYLEMKDKQAACRDFRKAFEKGCLPAHHYLKTECGGEGR